MYTRSDGINRDVTRIWIKWACRLAIGRMAKLSLSGLRFIPSPGIRVGLLSPMLKSRISHFHPKSMEFVFTGSDRLLGSQASQVYFPIIPSIIHKKYLLDWLPSDCRLHIPEFWLWRRSDQSGTQWARCVQRSPLSKV